jgi:hypothetical protein
MCGMWEALWDWEGGQAAETQQTLAEYKRNTSGTQAEYKRTIRCWCAAYTLPTRW